MNNRATSTQAEKLVVRAQNFDIFAATQSGQKTEHTQSGQIKTSKYNKGQFCEANETQEQAITRNRDFKDNFIYDAF